LNLKDDEGMMKIAQIGNPEAVAGKASKFIYLQKHEKEFLKSELVENTFLCLQNLFRDSNYFVGEIEGKGYVTKFKIYKFKDLHYAQSMFELVKEHIDVVEIAMQVDIKKGRFYRYGIQVQMSVKRSEVEVLTEVLQLLNLRPIFVKGEAYSSSFEKDLNIFESLEKSVGFETPEFELAFPSDAGFARKPMEKNRSRPVFDLTGEDLANLEPEDSMISNKSITEKLEEKRRKCNGVLRSFNCLTIDIGGNKMNLDIKVEAGDTAVISKESLSELRKSVARSLSTCAERRYRSVSIDPCKGDKNNSKTDSSGTLSAKSLPTIKLGQRSKSTSGSTANETS
jgi:hypothetical protein